MYICWKTPEPKTEISDGATAEFICDEQYNTFTADIMTCTKIASESIAIKPA